MPATKKGPIERLTNEWPSKTGRDVKVKDRIKTAEGVVIDVIGRWTKKTAKGNVPMVTGHVVSFPEGATLAAGGKGKKVGDRFNAVAANSTHVKPEK
jgi:hypothetical protein